MRTLYSRPSSSSVDGRTEPSRWQCSSALGIRRSCSDVSIHDDSEKHPPGEGVSMRNDYARFGRRLHGCPESLEIVDHRCEVDNVEWRRHRTFGRSQITS